MVLAVYSRFQWMQGERLLKHIKHKKDTSYFVSGLVSHDTEIWTPNPKKNKHLPNFYRCAMMARMGVEFAVYPMNLNTFRDFCGIDVEREIWTTEEMDRFAVMLGVRIDVYREESILGGKKVAFYFSLNESETKCIALLRSENWKGWATLLPTKKGRLKILARRYCGTCCIWMKGVGFSKHQSTCRRCDCGRAYKQGDHHATTCTRAHYDKKKKGRKGWCKIYKKSEDDNFDISTSFFADLETFTPNEDGIYRAYAAGFIDAVMEDKDAMTWDGMNCLDGFMHHLLEHCNGYLWFFNGGRFDCFFIVEWLLKNKIHIIDDSVLIDGNAVLAISFETKMGTLAIKDACRFLPGSLDDNCRAFGLSDDQSKSDFEHGKMKTLEDIDTYRDEYIPYLKLDVVALRAIVTHYAESVWKCYKLHLCKFVTSAHLAYAAFTLRLPEGAPLCQVDTKKDEANIRCAYRGGRVICGRPSWETNDEVAITPVHHKHVVCENGAEINWKKYAKMTSQEQLDFKIKYVECEYDVTSRDCYNYISDYLVYVDVNSLYPSAQINQEYPVGRYYHHKVAQGSFFESELRHSLHNDWEEDGKWKQRICQVDITCPNDIMVPFLMDRGEDKQTKQDLLDKKEIWYTGVELRHAILTLGYKVTRIYQYYQWHLLSDLFTTFVNEAYARKQAAERDTPIYTTEKNILNGCTGKFAQVSKPYRDRIFGAEVEFPKDLKMEQITQILSKDGTPLGWYVKEEQDNEFSKFPIQLSVFILAWSKIIMSNMMHDMNIHKEEEDGVIYGDTDSLILHQRPWNRLPNEKKNRGEILLKIPAIANGPIQYISYHPPMVQTGEKYVKVGERYIKIWEGAELGQAKQEIDGKIVKVIVLGPKNYVVIFLCAKTLKLMAKARCKSIPHTLKDYDAFCKWHVSEEEQQKALNIYDTIKDKSTMDFVLGTNIKSRYYIFEEVETGLKSVHSKIPATWFEDILDGTKIMTVLYGTMFRRFCPTCPDNILIAPDMKHRNMGKNSFWKRNNPKRIQKESATTWYPTAYPPGHYQLNENVIME